MKKLVETLADSALRSQKALDILRQLSESIQVDGDRILIGMNNSYLEVGDSISFVSKGKRVTLESLFKIEDLIDSWLPEQLEGTDEDLDEVEEDFEPFDDQDPIDPVPPMTSTVIAEYKTGMAGSGEAKKWNKRELNIIFPDVDFCTLDKNNNSFKLENGYYNVLARIPSVYGDATMPRLLRLSDGTEWLGSSIQSYSPVYLMDANGRPTNKLDQNFSAMNQITSSSFTQDSWVFAAFKVDKPEEFVVQQYLKTTYQTRTLGAETGIRRQEVYTQVMITKIG